MQLTRIGSENIDAFSHLFLGVNAPDQEICIGAIEDDEAAGVACYNTISDALMLDYIYVDPEFRRRGIATALLEDFLKEIKELEPIAVHMNFPEKEESLYRFILDRKFMIFRDGTSYRTPVKNVLGSKSFQKLIAKPAKNKVVRLNELTRLEIDLIRDAMDKEGFEANLLDDPTLSDALSLVTLDQKTEKPTACVFCRQTQSEVCIVLLVNFSKDPLQLVDLIGALKDAAEKEDLMEKDLIFVTMDDDMERLPKALISSEDMIVSEGRVISAIRMLNRPDGGESYVLRE